VTGGKNFIGIDSRPLVGTPTKKKKKKGRKKRSRGASRRTLVLQKRFRNGSNCKPGPPYIKTDLGGGSREKKVGWAHNQCRGERSTRFRWLQSPGPGPETIQESGNAAREEASGQKRCTRQGGGHTVLGRAVHLSNPRPPNSP